MMYYTAKSENPTFVCRDTHVFAKDENDNIFALMANWTMRPLSYVKSMGIKPKHFMPYEATVAVRELSAQGDLL